MANKMVKYLGAYRKRLKEPLILNDFDSKATVRATHQIRAIFEIDKRFFPRKIFLIIPTSNNIFIGQKW